MNTKEHYENHLAAYYTWISGGIESQVSKNYDFFELNDIKPNKTKVALDLGCGSGFQSIALSKLNFDVISVDFSKQLLRELDNYIEQNNIKNIKTINSNISNFNNFDKYKPELIICMGDTLTHLENIDSVNSFIKNCFNNLNDEGKLILTFRNYSNQLKDEQRFIPVKNNENLLFTCFIEYFETYIKVFDIVNLKENEKWVQKISSYRKLIISPERIITLLDKNGFKVNKNNFDNGLITIIATKII